MNLLLAFARIKGVFNIVQRPQKNIGDFNAHMRKDLGLCNVHQETQSQTNATTHLELVGHGILTRGP
ncbi:hypothetical protein ACFOND_07970 [Reinekea marina]|uniref:Uncharacterized protein n=1 Tax=Reinekea marina TaxID=1310421 RepID=A0ABV7WSY0_9GAMM